MAVTTRILTDPAEAAAVVRAGGLVAFPTETVYGLGALALDERAVARIFAAKGRPPDNPLIVHVADRTLLDGVVADVPAVAGQFMDAFWPGPLSLVLPRTNAVPSAVTAGLDTVAVRVPDHPVALAFLAAVGGPVAAPSANRSGRPSPTAWESVRDDLDGRIDAILQGGPTRVGLESTVVDCTGPHPVVLRRGSIALPDLQSIAPGTRLADDLELAAGRSPGVRHPHYRPDARVHAVDPSGSIPPVDRSHAAWIGLRPPPDAAAWARCEVVPDAPAYARRLFAFFRECEREQLRDVVCLQPADADLRGVGDALLDRIRRAAG